MSKELISHTSSYKSEYCWFSFVSQSNNIVFMINKTWGCFPEGISFLWRQYGFIIVLYSKCVKPKIYRHILFFAINIYEQLPHWHFFNLCILFLLFYSYILESMRNLMWCSFKEIYVKCFRYTKLFHAKVLQISQNSFHIFFFNHL